MARRRMLDPEFFFDEELALVEGSAHLRLFYQGLWCHCDDNYHTVPYRPSWLKAQIFPYETVDIVKMWGQLADMGKIVIFKGDDELTYGYLKNFGKYQRVDKPSGSKYKPYPEAPVVVVEDSESTPAKEKRSKDKLREEKPHAHLTYLTSIPPEDLKELVEKYDSSARQVERKAETMHNYCLSKGKTYKNYRAFLENGLDKDFGRRVKLAPKAEVPKPSLSAEELAKIHALKEGISSKFRVITSA